MEIKKFNWNMASDLLQLWRDLDEHHRPQAPQVFQKYESDDFRVDLLKEYVDKEDQHFFLAYDEDIAMGFIYASINESSKFPMFVKRKLGYIQDLYVRPEGRGKGIGKALIAKVEQIFAEQQVDAVELHVFAFNEGAIALYQRLGYEVELIKMSKHC